MASITALANYGSSNVISKAFNIWSDAVGAACCAPTKFSLYKIQLELRYLISPQTMPVPIGPAASPTSRW
jgi:hypothetical protein